MEIEGQFALREILFVLQKKSVNARPIANDLFDPPKFSQFRQLALELWRPTIFVGRENLLFHERYPSTCHHIS